MNSCEISILNWEKYQGDSKRFDSATWFRLQNQIWMHELWDELEPIEFKSMIFLFSLVSQKAHKTGKLVLNFNSISRMSGIPAGVFRTVIWKLANTLKIIEFSEVHSEGAEVAPSNHGAVTVHAPGNHCATEQNNTEQNRTEGIVISAPAELPPPPSNLDLQTIWNENCGQLPRVKDLTVERKRKWKSRSGERPDKDYWISVIKRMAASAFLTGENDRGWKANVDFFLRPDTHIRVMEGTYDHRGLVARKSTLDVLREMEESCG